jgi:hypothetical protein
MPAMPKPPHPPAAVSTAPTLVLDRPDLERSVRDEPGFRLHLLRWLVAVASADGYINLAEYQVIHALAEECDSALELATALRVIEQPVSTDAALAALREAAAPLDGATRRHVLDRAMPLLRLQGAQALPLASALADALDLSLSPDDRATCGDVAGASPLTTSLTTALTNPLRTLQGRSLRAAAVEAFRMTGDSQLSTVVHRYAAGDASLQDMRTGVATALKAVDRQCVEFEQRLRELSVDEAGLQGALDSAEQLFQQIGQRLAIVEARIQADKLQFEEEFEEVIHDAGNAVELEMLDRLKTDDWTLKKVWDSMGRSTFAKELERRVDRIARRHERQLQLMKEDLRLFQQEYRLVQAQVLARTHHTKLSSLMPGLRAGTRILNATEDIANVTLASGVLAGIGTGAAIYALGAAVVLPVIAPIAPFAGAAVVVAGAFKWMMDKPARKGEEVRDKRLALEQALRERLSEMRTSYFAQLDQTGQEFLATARVLARPVLLEAQARRELVAIERRVGESVLRRHREAANALLGQIEN